MIKAVFFDLYQTLITYDPPREVLIAGALAEFGIDASPEMFLAPIVTADEYIYNEIARQPLSSRSPEEKLVLYTQHQAIMLKEAGIEADKSLAMKLLVKMQQATMNLVLFDDVDPALSDLKKRGLFLGMISNVEDNMGEILDSLGLTAVLDAIITSQDAGVGKPNPQIFLEGLKRPGVRPEEALYVGDQYQVDIVGARNAGIQGILLDRTDHYQDITDCPRIKTLSEIINFL